MKKTRFLAVLLCAMLLVTLLPTTAFAATTVSIGGTPISSGEYFDSTGGRTHNDPNDAWDVHRETVNGVDVLTLKGLRITTDQARIIDVNGDITLNLIGSNEVTSTFNGDNHTYGIIVAGAITVTGGGNLTATGGTARDGFSSCGVCADHSITMSGTGTLTGKGGAASTSSSYGVRAKGDGITVNSGTLTGNSGSAQANVYGVDAQSITVSGTGTLNGNGARSTDGNSTGVMALYNVTISGNATMSAMAGEALDYSTGIEARSIRYNGGTLIASGTPKGTSRDAAMNVMPDASGAGTPYCWRNNPNTALQMAPVGTDANREAYLELTDRMDYTMDFTLTDATWGGLSHIDLTAADASGTGWNWAYQTKTLTLNGLSFTTTADVAVKLPANTTVILNGSSKAKSEYNGSTDNTVGVLAIGALTVKGTGSLEAAGGNATVAGSYGVYTFDDMTMQDSAAIHATAGNGDIVSQGVSVFGSLTLGRQASTDSCVLTGTGGTAEHNDGVVIRNGIAVSANAQLTGTGGTSTNLTDGMSSGVATKKSIEVSGNARVTGTAGNAFKESIGVAAGTGITVSGGSLKGTGSHAIYNSRNTNGSGSYGVHTISGNITVSGGTLEAESGAADASGSSLSKSYGVYAPAGSIAFSGGALKAKSGACSEGRGALGNVPAITADPYLWRTADTGAYTTGNITSTAHTGDYLELNTAALPTVTSVTVSPATASAEKGGSKTFTVAVTGANSPAQTVTWDVEGETSASTTINASGVLTVGSDETATTLTVRATSAVDTSKSGTATITVTTAPTPPAPDSGSDSSLIWYQMTEGQYGEWKQGGGNGLRFTANADRNKLMSVSMDNSVISSDKYTVQSGSTIVTLKAAYLSTLSAGRHTLRMNFTDGYAETYFTVNGYVDIPKTGDAPTAALWPCALLMAGAGLAASLVIRRKRQNG